MADKNPGSARPLLRVKGFGITGRALGLGLVTVALVWFVAVNTQSVRVRLWVPTVTAPLWLILAATAVVAAAIGWFVGRRRLKRARRREG